MTLAERLNLLKVALLLTLSLTLVLVCESRSSVRICKGTSLGLSHRGRQAAERHRMYRLRYRNCTVIDGNLEIVFLDAQTNYDLRFLKHIREITGYLLVVGVYSDHLPLHNLRIIRGYDLYKTDDAADGRFYSVYLARNYRPGSKHIGLKEVQFQRLYEITQGHVKFSGNNLLCHTDTIAWKDILLDRGATAETRYDATYYRRQCPACDPECAAHPGGGWRNHSAHCWDRGYQHCQVINRIHCAASCAKRACYENRPKQCCHVECAGACVGPRSADCWACRHYALDGRCVRRCPPEQLLNPHSMQLEQNPHGRVSHAGHCVRTCPAHLLNHRGTCVDTCPAGTEPNEGRCRKCSQCPTNCSVNSHISALNINKLRGCNTLLSSLRITQATFDGDRANGVRELHPHELEAMSDVTSIEGYLEIQASHSAFRNLTFLRNLRVIHGRPTDQYGVSVIIYRTSLHSLAGLSRLKHVINGQVLVTNNRHLCFAQSLYWRHLVPERHQAAFWQTLHGNRPTAECERNGQVCDASCLSPLGCWSTGNDACLSCARTYNLEEQRCVALRNQRHLHAPTTTTQPHLRHSCHGNGEREFVNVKNVERFRGCRRVLGNLRITQSSLFNSTSQRLALPDPRFLQHLNHVSDVTGYLLVQVKHPNLTDLSFLSGLRRIHGKNVGPHGNALRIYETSLQSLHGLEGLKTIVYGNVLIGDNPELCGAEDLPWDSMVSHTHKHTFHLHLYENKRASLCEEEAVSTSTPEAQAAVSKATNKLTDIYIYLFSFLLLYLVCTLNQI